MTRKNNIITEDDENYTESEYLVTKTDINKLTEHTNKVIEQYKKEIIEAKGNVILEKQKNKEIEKTLEKHFLKIKELQEHKNALEIELSLFRNKETKKNPHFKMEKIDMEKTNKEINEEVKKYCENNRGKMVDNYIKQLNEKYNIK